MYAIKGSWVGQTFALAKSNGSEGRKSRIRRSKEERKAMVDSFIKNYQRSNNGNFPSLNLTHKEVGGSYYIVREIVRELIQENRVLGPAKLIIEEQNTDRFSEQYILGSISMEPQLHMSVATSETELVLNHLSKSEDLILNSNGQHTGPESQRLVNDQIVNASEEMEPQLHMSVATSETELVLNHLSKSEDLILNSNGQHTGPESQRLVNDQIVNASEEHERNNEADEFICEEMQVIETVKVDKIIEENLEAPTEKVSQFWDNLVVETFPLRPVPKPAYSLNGTSDEAKNYSNGTLKEEVEDSKVSSSLNQSSLDNSSSLVDKKAIANAGDPLLEMNSGCMKDIVIVTLENQFLEGPHLSSIKKGNMNDIEDGTDLGESPGGNVPTLGTFEQVQAIAGIKSNIASNGIPANINGTDINRTEELIYEEASVKENKIVVQPSSSSQKGSKPTLDRINLESWEGASKKPAQPESNPVLAIFKAFVAAFVKFWSE